MTDAEPLHHAVFDARRSGSPIEVWADVGGTFTDCFVVQGTSRRSTKLLSSGRVRSAIVEVLDNRVVADGSLDDVDDFWIGATVEFLRCGESSAETARVIGFCGSTQTLRLDRVVPNSARPGDVLELDAGLEAPVLAARRLLACPLGQPLPLLDVRLGTTRGTNALLTRRGAEVALVTTLGFGDLLEIGEQTRPELFELAIRKPEPLTRRVIEVDQRLDFNGNVLRPLDEAPVTEALREARAAGATSLAVCLLHAHVNPEHEVRIGELAAPLGFDNISLSSHVAPLIKLVARAETTVLDAYLSPVLKGYLTRLRRQFDEGRGDAAAEANGDTGLNRGGARSRLRLMTSGGNLVDAEAFRGCDSILSGPAGGVVSLGKIARCYAAPAAIGLDMGGTSTDVSRFEGQVVRQYESRKAGIRVLTPMIAIHTVAAGGGSICDVVAGRMIVGPQSAGSVPGPACYGRGGPLTVTDLNVVLGRLPDDRFPFRLDIAAARSQLAAVNAKLGADAFADLNAAAAGFWRIAVTHMAEAVRTVSTSEGADPRGMTLVGFGGAAGGHLCGIADEIGITRLIDHRDASLLSALGMGLADVGRVRSVGVYRLADELDEPFWDTTTDRLRQETLAELAVEMARPPGDRRESKVGRGESPGQGRLENDRLEQDDQERVEQAAQVRFEVDLRYHGSESPLSLPVEPRETMQGRFHQAHRDAFGYDQRQRRIEVAAIRCEAILPASATLDPPESSNPTTERNTNREVRGTAESSNGADPSRWPVRDRSEVATGTRLNGPCIVLDDNSTLVIDPGWVATKLAGNSFELQRTIPLAPADRDYVSEPAKGSESAEMTADAVSVEVVARRFQGIADEMGELLRRTAVSVNVKERLDFSCAVFDRDGTLLANAPHVPVHLGAMGHTVRQLMSDFPQMSPGDAYLSNDPYAGGSHLPDVTLVTPVFCEPCSDRGETAGAIRGLTGATASRPDYYVANRAHHAEIGGKSPGSMPPDATSLAEEGVLIRSFALSRAGVDHEAELRRLLTSGEFPSRSPELNLADIAAQRAAGVAGAKRIVEMVARMGRNIVAAASARMLDQADQAVGRWIAKLGTTPRRFTDTLDDGTPITVRLVPHDGRLTIDFTGTSPVHPLCFNAPLAVPTAATLYVLRCLIGGNLPMNGGITSRIDLVLPSGLLNPPRGATLRECPAVVAGNVETSMRLVDVLLGALGVAAASQGTMNNVLIGDATFGYYETIGGGSGATPTAAGADGVHCHMTNTRITDPEVYESRYPVRLWRFSIRRGSGGRGTFCGGDGLVREIEFLRPLTLSLLTNRRGEQRPWGCQGGEPGAAGRNLLVHPDGTNEELPAWVTQAVQPGDRLRIETPGGGGWGGGCWGEQPEGI